MSFLIQQIPRRPLVYLIGLLYFFWGVQFAFAQTDFDPPYPRLYYSSFANPPAVYLTKYDMIRCATSYRDVKTLNPKVLVRDLKGALFRDRRDVPIADQIYPAEAIWQCTTCGACQYHCPLGIEHLAKVVGTRRYKVAESAFPEEAVATFQGLERNYNPWNYGRQKRADLIEELGIPLFAEATEYYLWLGCFGAFDPGYRPVVEALLRVLRTAGVSFGVLEAEVCCGDPARVSLSQIRSAPA